MASRFIRTLTEPLLPVTDFMAGLGVRARQLALTKTPDPFTLALVLTALAFAAACLGSSERSVFDSLELWSGSTGMWRLLRFSMQASLMLVLGGVLADTPVFHSGLGAVAKRLPTPRSMVAATAAVSVALALINWSLSIVGGALFARECGRIAQARGFRLHYPLLCAAGYSGLMAWHGGLSGTAPLKVTRAQDLAELMGAKGSTLEVITLQQTLFSPLNLVASGGVLLLAALCFALLTPRQDPDPQPIPARLCEPAGNSLPASDAPATASRAMALALALCLGAGAWVQIQAHGASRLDLNVLNLGLWSLSLLAHGRLDRWLSSVQQSVSGCAGILVQFPLYAGIMGLATGMGLSSALAEWMQGMGTQLSLLFTFASAALLNLFVPSGGGQWAIQGPVLLTLAARSGQDPGALVMAMAYGDQLTNMIQPFWALPLLAITGVRAKDIAGYCALWMILGTLWFAGVLMLLA